MNGVIMYFLKGITACPNKTLLTVANYSVFKLLT